jgi:hypothetical protein
MRCQSTKVDYAKRRDRLRVVFSGCILDDSELGVYQAARQSEDLARSNG